MIRARIGEIFYKEPCVDTANAMEIMKQNNGLRQSIFVHTLLKDQVKKLIGTDLSYHRNYVKKKLFSLDMSEENLTDFVKHLFGAKAVYDEAMKKSAASLRYFRDKEFKGWEREVQKETKNFADTYLKGFYEKYSNFRSKIIAEMRFKNLNDFYEAVLASDLKHYKNQNEPVVIE